jgi:hypothetical protein
MRIDVRVALDAENAQTGTGIQELEQWHATIDTVPGGESRPISEECRRTVGLGRESE